MATLPGPITYIFDHTEPGLWEARCPELGIASFGKTLEDAERMIQEAVTLWLEEVDRSEVARVYDRERTVVRAVSPAQIAVQ